MYKVTLVQEHADKIARKDFGGEILLRLDEDQDFIGNIIFSDKSTFHLSDQLRFPHILRI